MSEATAAFFYIKRSFNQHVTAEEELLTLTSEVRTNKTRDMKNEPHVEYFRSRQCFLNDETFEMSSNNEYLTFDLKCSINTPAVAHTHTHTHTIIQTGCGLFIHCLCGFWKTKCFILKICTCTHTDTHKADLNSADET